MVGVTRRTVIKWLQRYRDTGELQELQRAGRPRSTTPAQDEALMDAIIAQPTRTLRDICESRAFPYQIGHRRATTGGLALRVLKKREAALQDPNKRAARVEWVRSVDAWRDWHSSTVWVDETVVESALTHRKRGWFERQLNARARPAHFVNRCGRSSVPIFGGLCAGELLPLVILHNGFNAEEYRALLEENYWPELQTRFEFNAFRYVQDNSPVHKSRLVREWTAASAPELAEATLFLPPYSPDLNPIEHVWARLKVKINARPSCRTRNELIDTVRSVYEEIAQESDFLQTLCDSMPRRLNAVLAAEGGPSGY